MKVGVARTKTGRARTMIERASFEPEISALTNGHILNAPKVKIIGHVLYSNDSYNIVAMTMIIIIALMKMTNEKSGTHTTLSYGADLFRCTATKITYIRP